MGGLRHGTQEICRQFYFLFLLPILFLLGLARQVRNLLTQFPLLLFLCYFSKTDIGQKKVSHPFCQCVSWLNWLVFQEEAAEATLEHIIFNVVPMGGPLLGPSIFYHLVIKRHVKKHGYEVRKWGTPSFLNTLDKRQKQGLLIRKKT